MSKEIPLSRGLVAVVDDEDYERLMAFRWAAVRGRCGSFYASRYAKLILPDGSCKSGSRQMQRDVLDPERAVPGSVRADHRNGDTLDNRRENLRWASHSISNINRRTPKNNTTGYRGVYFSAEDCRYVARISVRRRRWFIGRFFTPEEAAAAYNERAIRLHGSDARLNDIPSKG